MNSEPFSTLLIDDDDTTANIFQMIMDYHKLPFIRVPNAKLGLEFLQEHSASVIVIDIFLPDEDGYHLLREIRKSGLARGAGCVTTTMYHHDDTESELALHGFDGYLAKPLDTKHIVPYLQRVVQKMEH